MEKIKYEELLSSFNMFFADVNVSEEYHKAVNDKIDELRQGMQYINTPDGLLDYIKKEENALDNIILLLNVSSETFKRIISMLRIKHGHFFPQNGHFHKFVSKSFSKIGLEKKFALFSSMERKTSNYQKSYHHIR